MKFPKHLASESEADAYVYFDKSIRPLPHNSDGTINSSAPGFASNDVDAFRHAYVSGVFTQEYSETASDVFGRLNEIGPMSVYQNSRNPGDLNMDLWNNAVGRRLGKLHKSRDALIKAVHQALKNGELIINPKDPRKYTGAAEFVIDPNHPVIVLQETETGKNEISN